MSFTTTFQNGCLDVYKEGEHILHQPFKAGPYGQEAWKDEADALAWWESEKDNFIVKETEETTNTEE